MLHEKAIVAQIGIDALNARMFINILRMVPDLQKNYQEPRPGNTHTPDVVFVNADSTEAMWKWDRFSQIKKNAIPIMVTSGNQKIGNALTIKRPISFKKLIIALTATCGTAPTTPPTQQADTPKTSKMAVLIVDDSPLVRKFMEQRVPEILPEAVRMDFAACGEEAAQKIYRATVPYDLVFLDVVMPGVDGYKVCKWIKAKRPCYVVMLTGKSSPFDKVRGSMSGCDDYLTKPPDPEHLRRVLRNCYHSVITIN